MKQWSIDGTEIRPKIMKNSEKKFGRLAACYKARVERLGVEGKHECRALEKLIHQYFYHVKVKARNSYRLLFGKIPLT